MEEKILACLTWPASITSWMPSRWRISMSLAELAEGDPVAARGQRLDFGSGLLPDGDHHDFVAQLACGLQGQDGKRPLPAMSAYFT